MCYLVVIFLTLFNHEKLKVEAYPNNSEDIMKNYLVQRENILKNEQKSHLGNDITLESHEIKVNKKLMEHKLKELDEAMLTGDFGPSKSFYLSKTDIENSPVFQFIKKMPKGAALHTHHISLGSIKWIVSNLTYWYVSINFPSLMTSAYH